MRNRITVLCLSAVVVITIASFKKSPPVLYIIGDSTVASARPGNAVQGWGRLLIPHFDTSRITIENRAVSGISSKTYRSKGVHDISMLKNGMWDSIMVTLKPGDFVLIQFGHNDESPVNDSTRQRGTIPGIADDSTAIFNRFLNREEVVHSYGWYLRQYIAETRQHGAIPIICSPIPKNKWRDGKVVRNNNDYGKWGAETATATNTFFVDLNKLIADKYDQAGQDSVGRTYFVSDNVHTTEAGAILNASIIADALKGMKQCPLKKYLNR